jgi:nitroreductase
MKTMSFMELVKRRQSVRCYSEQPIEPEKIERCLEAARLAPSACNSQPWHFIIITEPDLKQKVAAATAGPFNQFNTFVPQVPVLIAIVTEAAKPVARIGGLISRRPLHLVDLGIAAEHFCLQAVAEDLGTCMLGWFNERKVKQLLKVPASKRIDLLIALGYPATEEVRPKNRKDLAKIYSSNYYQ